MRKINGKLLLGLLIGVAVLSGTVFAVHHFQYQRIGQALLWQAHHAREQGQPRREAMYLQRYLEFNPGDDHARAELAELWASDSFAGEPRARNRAVQLLDQVLARDDNQPRLRKLLVKVALGIERQSASKMVAGHLEKLLPWKEMEKRIQLLHGRKPLPRDAEQGELEGYWGQLRQAENSETTALDCFRLAVRHDPRAVDNAVSLAYLLRRHTEKHPQKKQQNETEANRVINGLVEADRESHRVYLARWRYWRDFDMLDPSALSGKTVPLPEKAGSKATLALAGEDVAQMLKRAPEDVEVLLAAADYERRWGQAEAAAEPKPEEREKRYVEHRDRAYGYLVRGLALYEETEVRPSALAHFELLWHKASLLLDDIQRTDEQPAENKDDRSVQRVTKWEKEVEQTINALAKLSGSVPAAADFLWGRLRIHQRRWAEAATLFEQAKAVLAGQPQVVAQSYLFLGECYHHLEEYNQMREAYGRARQAGATSPAALRGMALADTALNRLDRAETMYESLDQIGQMTAQDRIERARLVIRQQLQAQQRNNSADWVRAEECVRAAAKANPASMDVALLWTDLHVAQGHWDRAREKLDGTRTRDPKKVEAWVALADLERRQKRLKEAEKILTDASGRFGDRVELRLARARCLAEQNGEPAEKAAAISALGQGLERFSNDDRAKLLNGLADAQMRANNIREAETLWKQVAELPAYRTELRMHMLLFDLALRQNNDVDVQAWLKRIREIEGTDGAYTHCGTALWLTSKARAHKEKQPETKVWLKELAEASQHLVEAGRLRPGWTAVSLAQAQVAELQGNPELAINNLWQAVHNGETSPLVIQRLVALLDAQKGRGADVARALGYLPKSMVVESELATVAATVALRRNDRAEALRLAEEALKNRKGDYRMLVWQGRFLATLGETDQARKMLAQATQQAPKESLPWVARVQVLARAGDAERKEAEGLLDEVAQNVKKEERSLALAQCYEALGKEKEAQENYRQAAGANSQDPAIWRSVAQAHLRAGRLSEAEPLLRRLLEARGARPEDRSWARKSLALVLATGTDYQRFNDALKMVGMGLDSDGRLTHKSSSSAEETIDDKRTQARVLATQEQQQFRQNAIQLLEGLGKDHALLPDDEYVLALLYDAEGRWPKCRELLEKLSKNPSPSEQHLVRYAQKLIDRTERIQERLKRNERVTLAERNGIQLDLRRAEELIDTLQAMEKQQRLEPNAFASVVLRAHLRQVQDRGDEAVKMLRAHINRPGAPAEEIVLLFAALRRLKRYDEAYDLCEEAWRKAGKQGSCKVEVLGGLSVALLHGMKPSDAQVARIEQHLKAALAADPSKVVLYMHLADLYDQRGKYPEAEAEYDEVLRREPNNVVALNNLAWMYTLRQGKGAEAEKLIQLAIEGFGRRPELLDTRGLVRMKLGQTEQALADFKEAIDAAPTPTRYYHWARAYHQVNQHERARTMLVEARKHGLEASSLHPIEQHDCRKMLEEYKVR